jgi:hypothetical protein
VGVGVEGRVEATEAGTARVESRMDAAGGESAATGVDVPIEGDAPHAAISKAAMTASLRIVRRS